MVRSIRTEVARDVTARSRSQTRRSRSRRGHRRRRRPDGRRGWPSSRCRWPPPSGSAGCSPVGRGSPTLALAARRPRTCWPSCCRRRGLGLAASSLVSLVGLVAVRQPRLLPRHERLRPAHPGQLDAMTGRPGVGVARRSRTAIAPVDPRTGFVLAAADRALAVGVPGRRLRLPGRRRPRDARGPRHPVRVLLGPRRRPPPAAVARPCGSAAAALAYVAAPQHAPGGRQRLARRATAAARSSARRGSAPCSGVGAIAIGAASSAPRCPAPAPTRCIDTRNPRSGHRARRSARSSTSRAASSTRATPSCSR